MSRRPHPRNLARIVAALLLTLGFGGVATAADLPHAMGLHLMDEVTYLSLPLVEKGTSRGSHPASVDLSRHFPSPGSQGRQGSCVGWAVAFALKSYQEERERSWGLSDEDHLFSPAYVYNQIKRPGGGANYERAFELLKEQGVASLADFPYTDSDDERMPSSLIRERALAYRIKGYGRINESSIDDYRRQLAQGYPVLVSLKVDTHFHEYDGGTFQDFAGDRDAYHAMVVVGYDDNRSALKLINSWGTDWGEDGYVWVHYDTFRQMCRRAFVVVDRIGGASPPPPAPAPVPAGPTASIDRIWVDANEHVDGEYGVEVHAELDVKGLKGEEIRLVAYFYFADGDPLKDFDGRYRTSADTVCVGESSTPQYASSHYKDFTLFIPHDQLHFSGHQTRDLKTRVAVYDKSDGTTRFLAHSDHVDFRWSNPRPEVEMDDAITFEVVRRGCEDGLEITSSFAMRHMRGKRFKQVAWFSFASGRELRDYDGHYRTADGQVSVSKAATSEYESERWNQFTLFIPLDQLHLADGTHDLQLKFGFFELSGSRSSQITTAGPYPLQITVISY